MPGAWGPEHFGYVSTAYVAGTHEGEFTEDDLDVGQGFRNSYERSKFEAEQGGAGMPTVCRFRSSDRASSSASTRAAGRHRSMSLLATEEKKKAFVRGGFARNPTDLGRPRRRRACRLRSGCHLLLANRLASQRRDLSPGRGREYDRRAPHGAVRFVSRPPPSAGDTAEALRATQHLRLGVRLRRGRSRRALEEMKVFFPYFAMRVRYGDRRTRSHSRRSASNRRLSSATTTG